MRGTLLVIMVLMFTFTKSMEMKGFGDDMAKAMEAMANQLASQGERCRRQEFDQTEHERVDPSRMMSELTRGGVHFSGFRMTAGPQHDGEFHEEREERERTSQTEQEHHVEDISGSSNERVDMSVEEIHNVDGSTSNEADEESTSNEADEESQKGNRCHIERSKEERYQELQNLEDKELISSGEHYKLKETLFCSILEQIPTETERSAEARYQELQNLEDKELISSGKHQELKAALFQSIQDAIPHQ